LLALALALALITQFGRGMLSTAKSPAAAPSKARIKAALPRYAIHLVTWFPFSEENALSDWEEKVFKGRVSYKIEKAGDQSYVRAASDAAASALYYKIGLDPKKEPVISWRWRVEKFPEKAKTEDLESREEHDFAARVYVIFPTFFIMNSKVLEYIWAKDLPAGSAGTSPNSKNIKLLVLESGPSKDGEWRTEERDITADYVKAFGAPPERDIGAVSFMTNAEHTGTSAEALYDDIKLGYKKAKAQGGRL
jgi:hypothetical protein